jgi:hypothetical protein
MYKALELAYENLKQNGKKFLNKKVLYEHIKYFPEVNLTAVRDDLS